jgi:hypothetical protein
MSRSTLAAGAYLALMAVYTYVVAESQLGYGSDVAGVLILLSLLLLHVAAGVAVARGWAILLPALAILIAMPAGYPNQARGEPLPIYMGLAFFSPAFFLLIAVGVAIARRTRLGGRWASESVSSRRSPGRSRTT